MLLPTALWDPGRCWAGRQLEGDAALSPEHLPSVLAAWKAPEPTTQGQHPHVALASASPALRAGEGVVFPLNMFSRADHSWLSL